MKDPSPTHDRQNGHCDEDNCVYLLCLGAVEVVAAEQGPVGAERRLEADRREVVVVHLELSRRFCEGKNDRKTARSGSDGQHHADVDATSFECTVDLGHCEGHE